MVEHISRQWMFNLMHHHTQHSAVKSWTVAPCDSTRFIILRASACVEYLMVLTCVTLGLVQLQRSSKSTAHAITWCWHSIKQKQGQRTRSSTLLKVWLPSRALVTCCWEAWHGMHAADGAAPDSPGVASAAEVTPKTR